MNTIVSQALATGLPVVTTRHSGLPEQVTDGDNGLLVDEGDFPALAACIARLLEEPDLIATLSSHARDHVRRRFDSGLLIDRQIAVYTQLMESDRPPV